MNIKANRMTFWDTCVIDKIVVTHLRNPVVGIASGTRGVIGPGNFGSSSTMCRVKEDSNQKKQVICYHNQSECRGSLNNQNLT